MCIGPKQTSLRFSAIALLFTSATTAHAAEGFQVRYILAGSLGGEIFAPLVKSGPTLVTSSTYIHIRSVTGNDGNAITQLQPGGSVALPAPAPAALYPTYPQSVVTLHGSGTQLQWNLGLGYVTDEYYGSGRLVYGLNLPYGSSNVNINPQGSTPPLNWNSAVPADTQAAVDAQFDAQYQATLATQGEDSSGKVTGLGDAEVQLGWLYSDRQFRMLAGAALAIPTGKYGSNPKPDIGFGNFYTLRPAVQLAYLPRPDIAIAGKISFGFNTKNKDNDLRSGDWAGVEAAAGYLTPAGPIGVHMIHIQQYQDDRNNPLGSSRYRNTLAGIFFTTKIPFLDAIITYQYMNTVDSRNARHGNYNQLRMIKTF